MQKIENPRIFKINEEKILNLGICHRESHEEFERKFICLADSCKFSEVLCESCVFSDHSDHRISKFVNFVKKTPQMFAETIENLAKLTISLNKQLDLCKEIEETCENLKKFIKNIEEKAQKEMKLLEIRLNEVMKSQDELSCFNADFFEFFLKQITNEEINDKISQIRTKLVISGNSDFSLKVPSFPNMNENPFFLKILECFKQFQTSAKSVYSNDLIIESPFNNLVKYVKNFTKISYFHTFIHKI